MTSLQVGGMLYIFYGSVAILIWKCGTQLISETDYKPLCEETDVKKRGGMKQGEKYTTIIY